MYDAILVPTDGSDHALAAARHGLELAARFDASVHVLGVVDVQTAAGPFDAGGISGEFLDRLDATAEEWIDAVESVAPAGADVRTATVHGRPRRAILEYIPDHGIDLVAMGTHGRSGIRRFVAGSVTEHVLRQADVPVLTAKNGEREVRTAYERVLIPTDASECAEAAIDHGLAIAEAYDATVHALNVVNTSVLASQPEATPDTVLLDQLKSQGETATEAIADRARTRGLEVETAVLRGLPKRTLLEYADEASIDLITMGTHGRSGFDRLILGSTTERTVRAADVPVVAVPSLVRED